MLVTNHTEGQDADGNRGHIEKEFEFDYEDKIKIAKLFNKERDGFVYYDVLDQDNNQYQLKVDRNFNVLECIC